jgi:hypothetical protein
MALPLKIREEIDGFLITPWVKTIQERRPGIYTTTALLAPLPQGIPESRRQASKTRVEGLVIPRAQFLMMKYALYDNFSGALRVGEDQICWLQDIGEVNSLAEESNWPLE